MGDTTDNNSGLRNLLADALYQAQFGSKPKVALRVTSKRTKHSQRLAERIGRNTKAIDELIEILKSLNKKSDTENEVDKLIDLTKEMLENNAKLKEQVGDALQDIPING